jgi:hypothetical protein
LEEGRITIDVEGIYYCTYEGRLKKFVDWRQYAAVMQREVVTYAKL